MTLLWLAWCQWTEVSDSAFLLPAHFSNSSCRHSGFDLFIGKNRPPWQTTSDRTSLLFFFPTSFAQGSALLPAAEPASPRAMATLGVPRAPVFGRPISPVLVVPPAGYGQKLSQSRESYDLGRLRGGWWLGGRMGGWADFFWGGRLFKASTRNTRDPGASWMLG